MMNTLDKNIIRQALDLAPLATLIIDLKGQPPVPVYANQAFEALSGYDASELGGLPWGDWCGSLPDLPARNAVLTLPCNASFAVSDQLEMDLMPLYDRPGEPRYWLATERPLKPAVAVDGDADGEQERAALRAVLRDARRHLRRLDGRDSLTGLLDQRAFADVFERDWALARRDRRSLALILVKLDFFAEYRAVFGRHAADASLRRVAHVISGSLRRTTDLVARYGEDTLMVLLSHADATQAGNLAERMAVRVRNLAIHHPRSARDRFVTVSVAVGSCIPAFSQANGEALLNDVESRLAGPATAAPLGMAGLVR